MSAIGLDTVKLRLGEYDISPDCLLEVMLPNYCHGTGETKKDYLLGRDVAGGLIKGTRAFFNADNFNVTLQPLVSGDEKRGGEHVMGVGCFVQFSAPKLLKGDNYEPTSTVREANECFDKLESQLSDMGIKTDIGTASLSRMDTTRNVVMDAPFPFYAPVLGELLPHSKRLNKREYDGQGFLWQNGQQQLCVYDKLCEMKARKLETDGFPSNTLRFEQRLMKSGKIRDSVGFSKVNDLCEGFETVAKHFRNKMEKEFFKYHYSEIERMSGTEIEEGLRYFKETLCDRYWFENWAKAAAFNSVIQRAGVETVMKAVRNVTDNRSRIQKIERRLREMQMNAAALQKFSPCKRTLADLYEEMRQKVLAA